MAPAVCRRSRAFTLVELLVVIGIIAVLIGILLPSLSAARRQAETVKCASALRQIGTGFQIYSNEYRGYIPPAKVSNTPYHLNGVQYYAPAAVTVNGVRTAVVDSCYWQDFISAVVSKYKKTNTTSVTAAEASDSQNSIMWGCTTFQKYNTGALGDFNRQQTGYGMNALPTYSTSNPAVGADYPDDATQKTNVLGFGSTKVATFQASGVWPTAIPEVGTWFKLRDYTHPSERCLVADAQFWLVEAKAAPVNAPIPGQKFYDVSYTYSTGVNGQTLFDFYRHGKFPAVQVGGKQGYYRSDGGRVAYNILYVDGHVATATDRGEAYKSIRMRFPG